MASEFDLFQSTSSLSFEAIARLECNCVLIISNKDYARNLLKQTNNSKQNWLEI